MDDLEIPERALNALSRSGHNMAESFALAARITLAGELNRQASELSAMADSASSKNRYMGLYDAARHLRDRAYGLDPGGASRG